MTFEWFISYYSFHWKAAGFVIQFRESPWQARSNKDSKNYILTNPNIHIILRVLWLIFLQLHILLLLFYYLAVSDHVHCNIAYKYLFTYYYNNEL